MAFSQHGAGIEVRDFSSFGFRVKGRAPMTHINEPKPQIQMMTEVGSDTLGHYVAYMWLHNHWA